MLLGSAAACGVRGAVEPGTEEREQQERRVGRSRRGRSVRREGGRLQPFRGKTWANLLMVCV